MKKPTGRFRFLLWGFIFWSVGFAFFYQLNSWEADFKEDQAAIARGDATAIELTVTKKWIQPDRDATDSHYVEIFCSEGAIALTEDRLLSYEEFKSMQVGQKLDGFLVNDHVQVSGLDRDPGPAKWFFLGFGFILGCIPMGMTGYQIITFDSIGD